MKKKNLYSHAIDSQKRKIRNSNPEEFASEIGKLPYRVYEVEDISDGRKVVIAKPGGKKVYVTLKREDFFVFIYDPNSGTLWQITHKQIYEDLEEKGKIDPKATIAIINALERVYKGEEPNDFLESLNLSNPQGEVPEALIKAYKWIWGEEDVNYPPPDYKGRQMVWKGLEKKGDEFQSTGKGLVDLREKLKNIIQ